MAKFLTRIHFLSIENNITKQQINHEAIQRVCHLYNDIFRPILLRHALPVLLHHLPCVIHEEQQIMG